MQAPVWTDFLSCSICTNKFNPTDTCPISLNCGHTLCTRCLSKLKTRTCPYDKTAIGPEVESHPPNVALLQLLGHQVEQPLDSLYVAGLSASEQGHYRSAIQVMGDLALVLKPLAEHGTTAAMGHLTKPMLKKLVTVVNCQMVEEEGRMRALRAARSIADRTVTELLVMHQNQQQVSTLLWTAVRNRGCQFLGPVMQEEALKLILRVLESGNSLSRKNIVLFVVQRLSVDFPQASKTSIGHVVQLLYRASCFNVEKRDDDSSLMQLKEEFRVYESLRREHDSQIIRMALEAGLRISPEQWSTLLYGDHKHKSDMQSIIDKLTAQGAVSSGLSELIVAIGRSQDPYQLSEKVLPHLETILRLQVDKESDVFGWEDFSSVLKALLATLQGFSAYMQIQSGRFKTGMCPYLSKPGGCPKGDSCTYAHTEEERDKFRNLVRPTAKPLSKPRSGEQYPKNGPQSRTSGGSGSRNTRYSGELGPPLSLDANTPLSSLGSLGGVHSSSGDSGSPEVSYNALFHSGGGTGEGSGYRLQRHSGPITAPVMPSQQELNVATVTRGVATANQVYLGPTDNAVPPYLPVATPSPVGVATPGPMGVDYHSSAHVGVGVTTYPVVPTPQQLDIDRLKLQHEVVKQVVESSSNFPKDGSFSTVGRGYGTGRRGQQEWVCPDPVSQSSSYCMSLSQQSSVPSYECSPRLASDTQSATVLSQQHGGQSAALLSQQHSGQSAALLSQQHGGQSAALLSQQHGGQSAALLSQQHGVQSAALLSQQHGGQSAALLSHLHGGQSAGLLPQQHGGHIYSTEQLLANMQDLRISQSGQECQVPFSVDFPPSATVTQSTTTPSSSAVVTPSPTVAITSGHAVTLSKSTASPHSAFVMTDVSSSGMTNQSPSRPTVTSSASAGVDSSVGGGGALDDSGSSNSKELEAEIRLLKEQLRERNQTIQQQQVQLQGATQPPAPSVQGGRYLVSQQQAYPNVPTTQGVGVQLMSGDDQASVAYGSHYLPQATQQVQSLQYTPQQIQAALALLMGAKGSGIGAGSSLSSLTPGSSYYPTVPVASSYQTPQQWSGPQATPPSVGVYGSGPHSMPIGSNVTPPGTGFIMSLPGNNSMPSNASQPSQAINPALAPSLSSRVQPSEHSDDGMLAAYIQMMEQTKAASGGPAYHSPQQQHPSLYAPAQNQYYYQQ